MKSEEWPKVGDEVSWGVGGVTGEVVLIHEDDAIIRTKNNKLMIPIGNLRSPRLDKLAKDVASVMCSEGVGGIHITIAKAVINGEIEGLEYKPE